jgi:hypothetical protein
MTEGRRIRGAPGGLPLLYVVIYEGRNGPRARPIIASRDPEIVRVVSDAIFARLHPIPKLRFIKRPETDDGNPV